MRPMAAFIFGVLTSDLPDFKTQRPAVQVPAGSAPSLQWIPRVQGAMPDPTVAGVRETQLSCLLRVIKFRIYTFR